MELVLVDLPAAATTAAATAAAASIAVAAIASTATATATVAAISSAAATTAVAAASTSTSASAATTTPEAAATAARFGAWACLVDGEWASFHGGAVEVFDGLASGFVVHLDEPEASASSGLAVHHDVGRLDLTELGKDFGQFAVIGAVRQIADVNPHHVAIPSCSRARDFSCAVPPGVSRPGPRTARTYGNVRMQVCIVPEVAPRIESILS